LRDTIPAPWRLSTTVLVSSEKTLPVLSVPSKTMGTCFLIRALRRTSVMGEPRIRWQLLVISAVLLEAFIFYGYSTQVLILFGESTPGIGP